MKRILSLILSGLLPVSAHDTWVQTNVAKVEAGQPIYADLMLGNHGNNHRDFLLDSKIPLAGSTLSLIKADGHAVDLKPALIDRAAAEKEGYWSVKVSAPEPGLYGIAHTYDAIVSYAPKRAIKSAKAFFLSGGVASASFDRPFGHPLEIIPLVDPITLRAGDSLKVQVLFKGKPLADAVISCIPRGKVLADGFDTDHEAKTDANGEAILPLPESNLYLIVTHRKAPEETGEGYAGGSDYGATLTVWAGNP